MTAEQKKAKLRVINQGTRYDVAGKLKHLARQIEHGEMGDVRDCVIAVRTLSNAGGTRVSAYHFGTDTIAGALYTWEAAKGQII